MSLSYLKLNVKIEPLSWQWYTWPYLISPVTAACNITDRHIPIMKSYIQAPQIHAQAVKNPKLLGGPYADLEGKNVDLVQELLIYTQDVCKELIELNYAIKEFDKLLQTECVGYSLDSYYQRVPDIFKGMVELVYDGNNHPSIRLIESLFYRRFSVDSEQSLSLSIIESDFRPFVLSTPYIEKNNVLNIKIPFSDKKIDQLVKSRFSPVDLNELQELLNIPSKKVELFRSFFIDTPPDIKNFQQYEGNEVRIRYFGHACILFETNSTSILVDPVISYDFDSTVPRYTFKDLPEKIDFLLLTHNHQDHILIETLLQIRHKVKTVVFPCNNKGCLVDPSLKNILRHLGFNSLIALDDMETISFSDGEIMGLPFLGEHSDLNIQSKIAYFVSLKGKKIILAADSNNIEPKLYEYIFSYIGGIDMLFIGMECDGAPLSWLYGPLLTQPIKRNFDNSRTLSGSNFEKAWKLALESKCKHAYVYAMGQEPWLSYIMALKYSPDSIQIVESDKFVEQCKNNNIMSERIYGKKEWLL